MPSRILFASDFSASGEAASSLVRELAETFGASVTLLHVEQPLLPDLLEAYAIAYPDAYGKLNRARKQGIETELERMRQQLAGSVAELRCVLRRGFAGLEIVKLAQAGYDLIVVGSRGRGPIRASLLGSTSTYVLHHSPCPVLIVPAANSKVQAA